ncbi:unnamed protein product [Adineta ricciae]|uniref:Carrier domain-containing protein n=1 Tax=Adineta ricciae TaxID=249248 RepID=A0A815DYF8_ADIRI|nr:unnamed protein product [Adineta ricciae]
MYEKRINMEEEKKFWKEHLNGFSYHYLQLPYDRFPKDNNIRSGIGVTSRIDLSCEIVDAMFNFIDDHQMTLFQVGLASFHLFLSKLTQESDLCVLTTTTNRIHAVLQDIIGYFENILPQHHIIDPNSNIKEFFRRVKQIYLNSMHYGHFPYQYMGESTGREILFLVDSIHQDLNDQNLRLIPILSDHDDIISKYDLTCSMIYDIPRSSVTVSFKGSCDLFNRNTLSTMIQRFEYLLEQIFTCESSSIFKLSLLLPNEVELLRQIDLNNKFPHDINFLSIHEQIASRVIEHPQKLSTILDEQSLTYAELYENASIICDHLGKVYRIQSNDIVALCVERSLEMPLGILAILMAGGIYCPLAPNHPQERLEGILRQTNARCVLTHTATKYKFQSSIVNLSTFDASLNEFRRFDEQIRPTDQSIDQVAYIIFTSGSTGEPKGVQLTHRNLLLTVASYCSTGSILPTDTALQITPCSFDAHVPELLGCLMMGGTSILLHPDGNMDLDYISQLVETHQATYMHSVPSHLSVICEQLEKDKTFQRLNTIRSICSSGEPMDIRSLEKFRQNTRATIFNLYGPAECTDVSIYKITQDRNQMIEPSCIGPLSPNLSCLILDSFMQTILPDGLQLGELFVCGPSVFLGYFNRHDLTRAVLIDGLTNDGKQFYKTGDLVRLDAKGVLHYVGRRDFMVKLRGQRIELSEIENTIIDASSDVTRCVVVKYEDKKIGSEYLIAYVQTTMINIEQILQQKCQERLPFYMVPSFFILLHKLPLSQNGKIDRKRLPCPHMSIKLLHQQDNQQSKTEIERLVSTLWCEILQLDQIPSITISFFKFGGNSLLLMKLYHSYHRIIPFDTKALVISQFFRRSTIRDHAELLETHQTKSEVPWKSFHINKG